MYENPSITPSESESLRSESNYSETPISIKQSDGSGMEDSGSEPSTKSSDDGEEGEGEEEGECGFCLFMKGGGCRDSFIAWEKCIEAAEKDKEDIVEKCFEVTAALKNCMEAHADYYEPILRAEKAAEEEAIIELEKEAEAKGSSDNDVGSKNLEQNKVSKDSEQPSGASKQD